MSGCRLQVEVGVDHTQFTQPAHFPLHVLWRASIARVPVRYLTGSLAMTVNL